MGGVIAYANAIKQRLLDVPANLLEHHGAVSEPVAMAMAAGARQLLQCDWAVAVSGVAGPGGGTAEKPVGLVYIAVAGPDGITALQRLYGGARGRDWIRGLSVGDALDQLRLRLS
jgi:nicotinamide-nucleotide amidase